MTLENLIIQECNSNDILINVTNEASPNLNTTDIIVNIVNLKFIGNSVMSILSINRTCEVLIDGVEMRNNTGTNSLIEIKDSAKLSLRNGYFENNFVSASGTILKSELIENVEIDILDECIFINNTAGNTQGGIVLLRGINVTLNIEDSYFISNMAEGEGGVLTAYEGPSVNISDSVFIENLSNGGGGGAIYIEVIYILLLN